MDRLMRFRVGLVTRVVVLTTLVLTSLVALSPTASAGQNSLQSCDTETVSVSRAPTGLTVSSRVLLPLDGTGFFDGEPQRVFVHNADNGVQEAEFATEILTNALTDFYGVNVDVEISAGSTFPALDESTRLVVLNGDVAIPGQPSVFRIGGAKTLFLHWSTAVDDMAALLDVPEFETLTSHEQDCSEPTPPPLALPPAVQVDIGDRPDELAYVNEEPDEPGSLGSVLGVPLADSVPTEQWPLPVLASALLLTAGGIVVHRRDQLFGRASDDEIGEAVARLVDEQAEHDADQGPDKEQPVYPVADSAPVRSRVIYLDEADTDQTAGDAAAPPARLEIDLHARRSESALTRSVEKAAGSAYGIVRTRDEFANLVNIEWSRRSSGGKDGAVASLVLSELDAVRLRLGSAAAQHLFHDVADKIAGLIRPIDSIGFAGDNELAILMPELSEGRASEALDDIAKAIAATSFRVGEERVLLTPATGFAMLSDTNTAPDLIRAVESARALSMLNLHLDPERWDGITQIAVAEESQSRTWISIKEKLRTPLQILLTFVIAWVIPFFVYFGMDAAGMDISFVVYVALVASLVLTGAFILAEGFMAIRQKEPPETPSTPYPKASALIAAYLPNEAATVIDTIDAFLKIEYPNDLQIILAYNTPDPLPVEEHLDRIALEHPNFVPVRIVGSNSKAQNVNAALSMAEGEFIGMFDADHQPRPDAFTRAWRWIDDGYDVVQGHCLTRNGDAGFLAKMIAVEFESIYAVAHPGRAKMHRFGVFGGSNGFWRTELLHETRMRGSMLTEDIDSSMRVVERGFKIRSDRDLVSRELATTTFKQVWNQRMRWAQGWFQVSIEHMKLGLRSKDITIRQKLGVFHLLMWRELYPWLSQQLIPLVAFWAVRAGGLNKLDWFIPIFVVTSIFTFSVGPLQTIFAYKLADEEIKQHKSWFWGYLLFTTPFYTEYKNLIARVAHIKQFMGESNWRVTPRSSDPDSEL